jgi:hypothetical protein
MNKGILIIILVLIIIFVFAVILIAFFLLRRRGDSNQTVEPVNQPPPSLNYGVDNQTQFSNQYQKQYWKRINNQVYIVYFTSGNTSGNYLLQANPATVYSGDAIVTDDVITLNIPSRQYDSLSPDGRDLTFASNLFNVFGMNSREANVLKSVSNFSNLTLDDSFEFNQYVK